MDRYKVLEEIGEVVDAPADSAKVLARVKRLSTQAKELRKEVAVRATRVVLPFVAVVVVVVVVALLRCLPNMS